jgi:polyisoprenoid-binding protein YceI
MLSGAVAVAAGSGKSGNDTRDRKMSTDILDAAHFADVSFTPASYQGTISATGDSTIQVTGTFTLHGTPHELTVPMQIHIEGMSCTAKTHFSIPM